MVAPRPVSPAASSSVASEVEGMSEIEIQDDECGFIWSHSAEVTPQRICNGQITNKVKNVVMTAAYRQKEGFAYNPSYVMGYGPSSIRAEKELDEAGGGRKNGAKDGSYSFIAGRREYEMRHASNFLFYFIQGMVNTDPMKRELAPLRSCFRWKCEQHKEHLATHLVMRAHSQRIFNVGGPAPGDRLPEIMKDLTEWVVREFGGEDGPLASVVKQMILERRLMAKRAVTEPLEKRKLAGAKINAIESIASGEKKKRVE